MMQAAATAGFVLSQIGLFGLSLAHYRYATGPDKELQPYSRAAIAICFIASLTLYVVR